MLRKEKFSKRFILISLILFTGFAFVLSVYAQENQRRSYWREKLRSKGQGGQSQPIPILDISGEKVKRVKTLAIYGGRVGWSPDGSVIAFDRPGADGYCDVWLMRPDGSDQRCLTCNNSQLPQNNGNPTWHPSGKYIVFQAEDPELRGLSQHKLAKYLASPGVAINNNLWVMTADGSQFWQLTHVKDRSGTLHPHFSPDGTKLLWSQVDGGRRYNRLGYWTIKLADFSVADGTPRISNIKTFKPKNLQLYEVHGFSPDAQTILFSGIKENEYYYDMEIYTIELSSGRVRQLTDNNEWDEHAHFTPDGRQIIWPSSEGIPQPKGNSLQDTLGNPPKLDYWIMNVDGSNKQRLSGFNDPDAPEYLSVPVGIGLGDFDIHPEKNTIVGKLRYNRRDTIVLIELGIYSREKSLSRRQVEQIQPIEKEISQNIKFIMAGGAFPVWSLATNKITFTKKVKNKYEVFVMDPNGKNVRCLTCNKPALKNCGHKGQSCWHPSGNYIIFSAENAKYPRQELGVPHRPGLGRNFNVWIMTANGEKFWQITNYPENWGVIETKFSHDGKKIYWNEEYSVEKYPKGKPEDPIPHPGSYWGRENIKYRKGEEICAWRVVYANIAFTAKGPKISNIRKINPPENFTLIEANGFTPDDKGFIYCYANLKETRGMSWWGELYTSDLEGKSLKRLTFTPWKHDEDPVYSPDGRKIIYKEATKGKGTPEEGMEIFLMDADGSNRVQLTHFSDPGYPEYRNDWLQIAEIDWSPDGKQIIFGNARGDKKAPKVDINSDLYLLTIPEVYLK